MKRRARGGNKFVSQSLQTINLLVRSLIMFEQKISTNSSSNKSLNSSDCAGIPIQASTNNVVKRSKNNGKKIYDRQPFLIQFFSRLNSYKFIRFEIDLSFVKFTHTYFSALISNARKKEQGATDRSALTNSKNRTGEHIFIVTGSERTEFHSNSLNSSKYATIDQIDLDLDHFLLCQLLSMEVTLTINSWSVKVL